MNVFEFLALKKELMSVLNDGGELVKDVKYAEGTVRHRRDGDYMKRGGQWHKVYRNKGRGASLAVTHAVKKIKAAKSVDELMDLVNNNISRFYDDKGKLLPVVQRLKDAVNESKTRINAERKKVAPEPKQEAPKAETKPAPTVKTFDSSVKWGDTVRLDNGKVGSVIGWIFKNRNKVGCTLRINGQSQDVYFKDTASTVAPKATAPKAEKTSSTTAQTSSIKVEPFSNIATMQKENYGNGYYIDFKNPYGGMKYTKYYSNKEQAEKAYTKYKSESLEELQKNPPKAESKYKNLNFSQMEKNAKAKLTEAEKTQADAKKKSQRLYDIYFEKLQNSPNKGSTVGKELDELYKKRYKSKSEKNIAAYDKRIAELEPIAEKEKKEYEAWIKPLRENYYDKADSLWRFARSQDSKIEEAKRQLELVEAIKNAKNLALKNVKTQADIVKLNNLEQAMFRLREWGAHPRPEDFKIGETLYALNPGTSGFRKIKVRELEPYGFQKGIRTNIKPNEYSSSAHTSYDTAIFFREDGSIPGLERYLEKEGLITSTTAKDHAPVVHDTGVFVKLYRMFDILKYRRSA